VAAAARGGREQSELRIEDWQSFVGSLDVQGAPRQLAGNCSFAGREGNRIRLLLDRRGAHYHTPQTEETLTQALVRRLGESVTLGIELADSALDTPARQSARAAEERVEAARVELESDATVRALKERFGATLLPDSIKPLS
jgi:DNA polymerase-3 subunit gamma/tau